MSTYIIADLKLFNETQREKLGYVTFKQMNDSIIHSWNKTVKPEDKVIIMGDMGNGTLEGLKSVITQLNGELTALSNKNTHDFSRKQWKEIGFTHYWNVSMFNKLPDGSEILYVNKPIKFSTIYDSMYELLVVDSNNPIEGMVKYKMLSADAAKWGYSPLDTDELLNIYNNMKEFEEMEDGIEKRSEIKEEGEE